MNTITIQDESAAGDILNEITLKFNEEYITVSEVIKARIELEISRYNNNVESYKKGLVIPDQLESRLNNKKSKSIDVEKQLYIALDAFKTNGFILLVDDQQVENINQKVLVDKSTTVSFIKLTPLVGG
ncbi:hypothetical protein KO494_09245 [Lacinutrix sp. C3R15]|uniref:hypothetical protein n=1 Tax=Flavobacteriaceae TaxID=49546 RepID=UPI001C09AEAD|nr:MULTISPECIES: hypothetical protein [Flavobacteriaceae]MBU2939721.1 hypothetical protein [Lacinutrix sp. C3R15]MDO6623036.1 hypothetical protein [Oceanihabitans sp. 1_MG-2023]